MKGPIASFFTASYQAGILDAHSLQMWNKLNKREQTWNLKDLKIDWGYCL